MAQLRTIEDLHDKHFGHKKFAKVCDLFVADGLDVTEIREYYEKFSFKLNGIYFEYRKDWKVSAGVALDYYLKLLLMQERLDRAKDAKDLGLKYFKLWEDSYEQYLINNNLEHTKENMLAYYKDMQERNKTL